MAWLLLIWILKRIFYDFVSIAFINHHQFVKHQYK